MINKGLSGITGALGRTGKVESEEPLGARRRTAANMGETEECSASDLREFAMGSMRDADRRLRPSSFMLPTRLPMALNVPGNPSRVMAHGSGYERTASSPPEACR